MANEFVIKKGFHSKADSQVTGSLDVSGALTAGGSVVGAAFPFTGDAQITGSLTVSGSFNAFRVLTSDVIIGDNAGASQTSAANSNVFIGINAAYTNTTGDHNVVLGNSAGYNMSTNASNENVIIGKEAGYGTATGGQVGSVLLGRRAGYSIKSGDYNIGIGYNSLYNNLTGHRNIAIGYQAGQDILKNDNIVIGYDAGQLLVSGSNIFMGSGSLGGPGIENQLRIGHADLITISASLATGDIIFPSTASAAYFSGDGSQLTNLPASSTFPYSGSAIISSSYTAGDTNSNVLKLIGSGSVSGSSLFEVQGAAGTLFAVNDGLDGELFAANNISGLPVMSANADNSVRLGKYNGFGIFISGSTPGPTDEAAKIFITGSIYNTGSVLGIHRPVSTHTTDFTASMDYLGNYNIVGGNLTCSVLPDVSQSVLIGAEYEFFQTSSAGNFFFYTSSVDVSVYAKNNNMNLAGQYSGASLKKVAANTWHLVGDLT